MRGHSIVRFAGVNTLYMLCFMTIRRNFRSLSQHFAADPGKKDIQSNNFLKLNRPAARLI